MSSCLSILLLGLLGNIKCIPSNIGSVSIVEYPASRVSYTDYRVKISTGNLPDCLGLLYQTDLVITSYKCLENAIGQKTEISLTYYDDVGSSTKTQTEFHKFKLLRDFKTVTPFFSFIQNPDIILLQLSTPALAASRLQLAYDGFITAEKDLVHYYWQQDFKDDESVSQIVHSIPGSFCDHNPAHERIMNAYEFCGLIKHKEVIPKDYFGGAIVVETDDLITLVAIEPKMTKMSDARLIYKLADMEFKIHDYQKQMKA